MADLVFTTNRTASPVRRETWMDREWLVAPVVGLVPGVLNGELVTREAVKPSEKAWEGVPLVIEHPKRGGQYISAQDADVPRVGLLRKPHVNGKLQGEMWFDMAALTAQGETGQQVLSALEGGTVLEVSTGYFRSIEEKPGAFNGIAYQSVAHDITPDHLAVLLSSPGACSVRDGCGVPRVNQVSGAKGQVSGCPCSMVGNQAGHTGAMVAFFLEPEDAQALAAQVGKLPAGSQAVPVEEMHVTLAYLGDVAELEADGKDQGRVLEGMMHFAQHSTLVRGRVNGLARFLQVNEDGTQALVALVDSPMLDHWRGGLMEMLEYGCDMHPMKNHAFTPHITLAYLPADAPTPAVTPAEKELTFSKVALAWGGQVTAFELQGEAMDMQTNKDNMSDMDAVPMSPKQKNIMQSALRAIAGALGITLKEADMDKKMELVQRLVANGCPLDESALKALEDSKLQILAEKFAPAPEKTTPEVVTTNATTETPAPAVSPDVVALAQAVVALTGKVDTLIANQKSVADTEKAHLVEQLVANHAPLPKATLEKLDLVDLQTMAQNLIPADYSLQTLGRQETGEWVSWDSFVAKDGGK